MGVASFITNYCVYEVLSNREMLAFFRRHFALPRDGRFFPPKLPTKLWPPKILNGGLNFSTVEFLFNASLTIATIAYAGWLYYESRKSKQSDTHNSHDFFDLSF